MSRRLTGAQDLIMGDFEPDVDSDKDDMTLLNEILNAPSTSGDDFSREWSAVFGDTPLNPTANYPTPAERERPPHESAQFMPSSLLDLNQQQQQMGAAAAGQGNNLGRLPIWSYVQ